MAVKYEVELKFPVSQLERAAEQLMKLGAECTAERTEIDLYLDHPVRAFKQTDEALRVRQASNEVIVAYKGPKVDATTKTRLELEVHVAGGASAFHTVGNLFRHLGFRPVRHVRKHRRVFRLSWGRWPVAVSLDRVEELGDFVELEVAVEPSKIDSARKSLFQLASHLGLSGSERRSYLELLLERDRQQAAERSS